MSVLKFVPDRGGVVLGDGGGGNDVEVNGEDERGELGGGGADPEQGGDGLVGGVGLGGGGGCAVTIQDSIKDLSKLTLFFLLIFDGGYLSGDDDVVGGG